MRKEIVLRYEIIGNKGGSVEDKGVGMVEMAFQSGALQA